ncbi:MAG: hypothetical protein ACKKL4_00555 [Patescibacteria group bacterium]
MLHLCASEDERREKMVYHTKEQSELQGMIRDCFPALKLLGFIGLVWLMKTLLTMLLGWESIWLWTLVTTAFLLLCLILLLGFFALWLTTKDPDE